MHETLQLVSLLVVVCMKMVRACIRFPYLSSRCREGQIELRHWQEGIRGTWRGWYGGGWRRVLPDPASQHFTHAPLCRGPMVSIWTTFHVSTVSHLLLMMPFWPFFFHPSFRIITPMRLSPNQIEHAMTFLGDTNKSRFSLEYSGIFFLCWKPFIRV